MEKSAVARKLGGAKIIRAHSLPERLIMSAEIARELGRRKPEKSCASKYFRLVKEKKFSHVLAGIAMRHGLRKELREAIEIHAVGDLELKFRLDGAEQLFRAGKKEAARKEVLEAVKSLLAEADPRISRAIYMIYRLRYSEVKPLARHVFRKKMEEGNFDSAYQVANQWRLWEERKKAALACVRREARAGNFEKARLVAGERGVGKKALTSAAKQIFSELMNEQEYASALSVAREFRVRGGVDDAVLAMFESCMGSGSYFDAAQLAKNYGMETEMKEAAALLIDSRRESNLNAAISHAKEFGFPELARDLGKKLIEIQLLFGDYPAALFLAEEMGESTREIAAMWFRKEKENGKKVKAIYLAIKYGLDEEKQELGREMFFKRLGGKDYSGAMKIAETCGLEEEKKLLSELKKFRAKSSQPR